MKDALRMADLAEDTLGLRRGHAFVASTGRIGVQLPMPQVESGIAACATQLGSDAEHAARAAEAIMTSDTRPKQVAVELTLGGRKVRIGGMCKGAGMIQPGMSPNGARPASLPAGLHATMLAFVTTDAAIKAPAVWHPWRSIGTFTSTRRGFNAARARPRSLASVALPPQVCR
jgi:glutamate N-acetyltransferase/amino-acid N-acetyltransferase